MSPEGMSSSGVLPPRNLATRSGQAGVAPGTSRSVANSSSVIATCISCQATCARPGPGRQPSTRAGFCSWRARSSVPSVRVRLYVIDATVL